MATFRVTRMALLLGFAALLVLAMPLAASAGDGYRGDSVAYLEEGHGSVTTSAPYTEYRADTAAYNEEGFGLIVSAPYTEYRADTGAYNEEGFGLQPGFAPYTEYRASTGPYSEEGFSYLK